MDTFEKGLNRRNTNSYKWDMIEEDVLPFWIADSDYQTETKVIEAIIERVKQSALGYTMVDKEYYQIVCKWINKHYHYNVEPTDIILTSGIVIALSILVKLFTKENDIVTVTAPVYNPFFSVVVNNNRQLLCSELIEKNNTYEYNFVDLEEKLKKSKMFILCNPHNPVGRVWKKEELDKIVCLCKKYNVVLVSDEIHCDIIVDENCEFYSVGRYLNEYNNIIVCTAPSKTFNIAGLMISNILVKDKTKNYLMKEYLENQFMDSINVLGVVACKSAYQFGEEWLNRQNNYLRENRDIVNNFFKKNIPNAIVYKLEGTYLMWVNLTCLGLEQEDLLNGLVKKGIRINDGSMYSPKYKGYIRINIACGREQLLEGLKRIKNFVEEIKR